MPKTSSHSSMKRILLFSVLFLIPVSVFAANFQVGETVEVTTDGNSYAAGSIVQVSEEVRGDVFLAGETVQINARVREDAFIVGKNIAINAPIGDDLHVFGETIVINGDVSGDVIAFGQRVFISSESRISGEVIIGGQNVVLDGWFDQSVRVMGVEVEVLGLYLKDINVRSGDGVTISEDADIRGDLLLTIPEGRGVEVPEGVVRGEVKRTFRKVEAVQKKAFPAFLRGMSILSLFSRILIGMFLIALVRGFAVRFGSSVSLKKGFWKTLGIGFLVLIVPPIAGIFLFLPVLTIPLGVLAFLAWGSILYISAILSGLLVANIFFPLKKSNTYMLMVGKYILGTILISMVQIIPVIGFVLTFAVYLLCLGSLFVYYRTSVKSLRKAHLL